MGRGSNDRRMGRDTSFVLMISDRINAMKGIVSRTNANPIKPSVNARVGPGGLYRVVASVTHPEQGRCTAKRPGKRSLFVHAGPRHVGQAYANIKSYFARNVILLSTFLI